MFGVAALSLPRVFLFSSSSSSVKLDAVTTGRDCHTNEALCELDSLSGDLEGLGLVYFARNFTVFR